MPFAVLSTWSPRRRGEWLIFRGCSVTSYTARAWCRRQFALRLVSGEVADALLLGSQRVSPAQASRTGYAFRYPSLEEAFRAILDARIDRPTQPPRRST